LIYGISDIHGDYDRALELLNKEGVVDRDGNWKAGDATLVCAGDSVDRGTFGWKVIRWFHTLELQAEQVGGRVIHLLGNHDMWLIGHAIAELQGYGPKVGYGYGYPRVEDIKYLTQNPELLHWFAKRPVICMVGDVLFQHADSYLFYLNMGGRETTGYELIREINEGARKRLQTWHEAIEMGDELTAARYWEQHESLMDDYLACFGANYVVHGHSPIGTRSEPFYYIDNKAILIDGIMSNGYLGLSELLGKSGLPFERGCVLSLQRDNWAFAV
jgi:hypothetical protein